LQRVVLLGDDDGGSWLHLSRLRDPGGGNSLHTNSLTRGNTPTPTLPRKRERERERERTAGAVMLTRFA
jgi:hypothetical protein